MIMLKHNFHPPPIMKSHFLSDAMIYFLFCRKIMENFEGSSDMYVTPQRPPFSNNLQTPPWSDQRCYEKVEVTKKTGARKKLVTIFQNPMFTHGGPAQASSYRSWKEAPQGEKTKEEPRKISQISPYMRNKLNGKFHSMKQSGPKVNE